MSINPNIYPDTFYRRGRYTLAPMTAVVGLKSRLGITVLADGLAFELQRPNSRKIKEPRTSFPKVYELTRHVIIGFSGKDLPLDDLVSYAEAMRTELRDRNTALSLLDIALTVSNRLRGKLPKTSEMNALIAGYEYDEDGKPINPHFVRLDKDSHNYVWEVDDSPFSTTTNFKKMFDKAAREGHGHMGDRIAPNSSAAESELYLLISMMVAESKFIGGEIRSWNLDTSGVSNHVCGYFPTSYHEGDILPK